MVELLDSPDKFSLHFDDVVFQVISQSPFRSLLPAYCLTGGKWRTIFTDPFSSWDLLEKHIFDVAVYPSF